MPHIVHRLLTLLLAASLAAMPVAYAGLPHHDAEPEAMAADTPCYSQADAAVNHDSRDETAPCCLQDCRCHLGILCSQPCSPLPHLSLALPAGTLVSGFLSHDNHLQGNGGMPDGLHAGPLIPPPQSLTA